MKTGNWITIALLSGLTVGAISMEMYQKRKLQAKIEGCRDELKRAVQAKSEDWAVEVYTCQVIQCVNTLIALRNGETNRILDDMENRLNSELYVLHMTVPVERLSQNTNTIRIMNSAARYRDQNPYRAQNEEENVAVNELLAKFKGR